MSSESFEPRFTIKRLPHGAPPQPPDSASAPAPTSAPTPAALPAQEPSPAPAAAERGTKKRRGRANQGKRDRGTTDDHVAAKAESGSTAPTRTGGRFGSTGDALRFLGSLAGARLSNEATLRRAAGPGNAAAQSGGDWWVDTPTPPEIATSLVYAAGGVAYTWIGDAWQRLPASGELPTRRQDSTSLDVSAWPQVDFSELLATARLPEGRYSPTSEIEVIATGVIGRCILERCVRHGLDVGISSVVRCPLAGGADTSALWLHISRSRGQLSAVFVNAIASLPGTLVARSVTTEDRSILVDVRCRAPAILAQVGDLVAAEEAWALGPADIGHWRLRRTGSELALADVVRLPDQQVVELTDAGGSELPAPPAARLKHRPGLGGRTDAVLLDDTELQWLRRFLPGQPISDQLFLIPGGSRHLLLAPGGLGEAVPLGVPLLHVGPYGLYVEREHEFSPPLPEAARRSCFGLAEGAPVAVVREGAYRFQVDRMVPAWSLWAGAAEVLVDDISDVGRQMLSTISAAYDQKLQERPVSPVEQRPRETAPADTATLLQQAARAEASGRLFEAAELLERAGDHGAAGRLYERAARLC